MNTLLPLAMAVFTAALVAVASLQWLSYVSAERALLVVEGIDYPNGEPTGTDRGLDFIITIKNGGRSVGVIKQSVVIPIFHLKQPGTLPENPNYFAKRVELVIPPITPGTTIKVVTQVEPSGLVPGATEPVDRPLDVAGGIRDGSIPVDVYGYLGYSIGIFSLWDGRTGFCYRYVPVRSRAVDRQFIPCSNPKYTYTD